MYLGNFGRKPHYYTANKNKVCVGHGGGQMITGGRSISSRWHHHTNGKYRRDQLTNAGPQKNILRIPQNLHHMVSQHNATVQNFFETARINHVLQKAAKTLLTSHEVNVEGVGVKHYVSGKGKSARHLIEFSLENAWAQSLPAKTYSKLLQSIIPQHQL